MSKFYASKESIEIMKQAVDLAEVKNCSIADALRQLVDGYKLLDAQLVLTPKASRE